MKLYDLWISKLKSGSRAQVNAILDSYYSLETEVYKKILSEKTETYSGTVAEFGKTYGLEPFQVAAFMDGINTSLTEKVDVNELEEDTQLNFTIIWKQLYINMIKAKATWLQELTEWWGIYSEDELKAIAKEYKASCQAVSTKVGRNDPCPCGSGRKYKNCCG